jgi:hypothetical protein
MQLDEVKKWEGRNGAGNGVLFLGVDRNSSGRHRTMRAYANDSVEASKWGDAGRALCVTEETSTVVKAKAAKPVEISKFDLMKADFRYERYFRMVELGVPTVAVCTRMRQNNTAKDVVAVFAEGHDCPEWNVILAKNSAGKKQKNMIWEPLDMKHEGFQEHPTVWSPSIDSDRLSRLSMDQPHGRPSLSDVGRASESGYPIQTRSRVATLSSDSRASSPSISRKSFSGRERARTISNGRRKKERPSVLTQEMRQLCKLFGEEKGPKTQKKNSAKTVGQILSGVISPVPGEMHAKNVSSGSSSVVRKEMPANVKFVLLDKSRSVNVGLLLASQFQKYGLSSSVAKKLPLLPEPLFAEFRTNTGPKCHVLDEAFKVANIVENDDDCSLTKYTIGTTPSLVHIGGKLSDTQLQALLEVLPTMKESKLLSESVEKRGGIGSGCVAKMELPEKFMYSTVGVKRSHDKISSVIFIREFEEHCQVLKSQIGTIVAAYTEAMKSKKLKRALEMILAIGNALNKTEFKGFSVRSLEKLTHTKSHDKSQSVLDFFVKVMVDHLEGGVLRFKTDIPNLQAASRISPTVCLAQLQFLRRGLTSLAKEAELCWEDELVFRKLQAKAMREQQVKQEAAERLAMDREDILHGGEHAFPPHLWRTRDLPTSFGAGEIIGLDAATGILEVKLDWGAVLFTHRDLHKKSLSQKIMNRRTSYSALMEGYFQQGAQSSADAASKNTAASIMDSPKMNRKFLSTLKSTTRLPSRVCEDSGSGSEGGGGWEDLVTSENGMPMVVHQPEDGEEDDGVETNMFHSKTRSLPPQKRGSVMRRMSLRSPEPDDLFQYANFAITKHAEFGFGVEFGTNRSKQVYLSVVNSYAKDLGDVDVGDFVYKINAKKCHKEDVTSMRALLDAFRVNQTVQFSFRRKVRPEVDAVESSTSASPGSTLKSLALARFSSESIPKKKDHARRNSALPRLMSLTKRSSKKELFPSSPKAALHETERQESRPGDHKHGEFLGELTAKSTKAENRRRGSLLGASARQGLDSTGGAQDILSHMTHTGRPHGFTAPDFLDLTSDSNIRNSTSSHHTTPTSHVRESRDSVGSISRSRSGTAEGSSSFVGSEDSSYSPRFSERRDVLDGAGSVTTLDACRESEDGLQESDIHVDITPFTHHLHTFAQDARGVIDAIGLELDSMGLVSQKYSQYHPLSTSSLSNIS